MRVCCAHSLTPRGPVSGCPRSHFHVYTCGIDAGARHAGLSENMTFVRILYSESHIFLADPTTLFVYEMRLIIHRCNTRNLEVPANILEPQHRCPSRCPAVTPPCINSASPHQARQHSAHYPRLLSFSISATSMSAKEEIYCSPAAHQSSRPKTRLPARRIVHGPHT